MIVWFIGMSGSGKSTLARALHDRLKPAARHLVLLDGDTMRTTVLGDADFTLEGRRRNAERISQLCRMLDEQGIHTIASFLSIFPEWQAWNRRTFSNYFEVFLDIPLATLKERDTKRLYAGAEAGEIDNVVGIDIPFPQPARPDLVIDLAQQQQGVAACVESMLARMPRLD